MLLPSCVDICEMAPQAGFEPSRGASRAVA
jgi:hypothetical protein